MSAATAIKRVDWTPQSLTIEWADGTTAAYSSLWLLDNRPENRDPHNGQRLIDVADLPLEPRITSALVRSDALEVEWDGESRPAPFDLAWLAAQAAPARAAPAVKPWLRGATLDAARDFTWTTVSAARANAGVRREWLTRLLQDGLAFVSGVPGQESALRDALAIVGRILETNYGALFDVRTAAQAENLAYTDLGLGLHTDNPYRDPVPGFQALHAIVTSPEGGESLFADGFALALHLRDLDPAAYARLTSTPVPFRFSSRDAELYAERPLIQLDCRGELRAVHYNSRSVAPLGVRGAELPGFYAAYRRFAQLLRNEEFMLKFRLREGDLVVFDNQRILHGRTAFSSTRHPRHLRGCYLSRDSVFGAAALAQRAAIPAGRA